MPEKNVPEIRFAGFDGDWERRKLGECVLIQRGGSPRPIEKYITNEPTGINWVKIGDVAVGSRYITSTKEKIRPDGEMKSRRVFKGDLILSNSMSFGRPYIMQIEGCIHDGWLLIRDENKIFDTEYLLQLLSSDYMFKQYKSLASGGVVNNLNSELVQSTTVLIPKHNEQVKLGIYFMHLDNLITLHQRKYDKLVIVKKSMLEKMFPKDGADVPEIRFAGFGGAWERRRITDIAKIFIGLVTTMTKYYRTSGTLLIRNSDIKDNHFEFSDEPIYLDDKFAEDNASRKLQIGDIVTVHTGDVGTSAVITEKEENAIGFATINTRPNMKIIDSNYLSTFFNTDMHKAFAINVSTGDGRTNYNLKDFFELDVSFPRLQEQKKIGLFFRNLDSLITLHQQELEKLKTIKKSMLDKMFV